jgi:hypothetical protein
MFSGTTIASSTTKPVEIASAISEGCRGYGQKAYMTAEGADQRRGLQS